MFIFMILFNKLFLVLIDKDNVTDTPARHKILKGLYDKFKNRTLYLIYFGLLISVSLFVIG